MTAVRVSVVLVVFLWTFIRGDDSVFCDLKKNCTLPCRFQPGGDEVIHWMIEKITIHSYYYNKDQLGNQEQRFRGRTSLFKDQISSGNASLTLTGVEFEDKGKYRCYTSTITGNQELFIHLEVDALVQNVFIEQSEKRITCRSEGIYPEPQLTWSTEPPSSLVNKAETTVLQNEQLYNISSSLVLSDNDMNLNYTCTVSTRKNTKRATLSTRTSISGPESERTIPCTDSKTPLPAFTWKFDHREVIVAQSGAGGAYRVSEKWRQHVRNVSESGSLTLKGLSAEQNGVYTCEVTDADDTLITNTFLQVTEESSHTAAIVTVVVLAAVLAGVAFVVWRCWKHKKKPSKDNSHKTMKSEMKNLKKPGEE